jgi:hypothetical protein
MRWQVRAAIAILALAGAHTFRPSGKATAFAECT